MKIAKPKKKELIARVTQLEHSLRSAYDLNSQFRERIKAYEDAGLEGEYRLTTVHLRNVLAGKVGEIIGLDDMIHELTGKLKESETCRGRQLMTITDLTQRNETMAVQIDKLEATLHGRPA